MRGLPDSDLVALAISGERFAFGELARRHSPNLRALLRRMGAQPALADDIAQDALLIAFERIETYRGEGPFGAWLYRIAARLCLKHWKSHSRVQLFADPPEPEAVQEEDSQSAVIDLDQALQSLMPAERLCVSLSHGAGWSHSEIAEQLRLPIGTVKSHIKRALDKLKTRLSDELPKSEGDT